MGLGLALLLSFQAEASYKFYCAPLDEGLTVIWSYGRASSSRLAICRGGEYVAWEPCEEGHMLRVADGETVILRKCVFETYRTCTPAMACEAP